MLLLAFALAMPMGSMAYLKIQHTRLSYEMSEVRDQIRQQEEFHRTLLLERSRFQRDEEIQAYADQRRPAAAQAEPPGAQGLHPGRPAPGQAAAAARADAILGI